MVILFGLNQSLAFKMAFHKLIKGGATEQRPKNAVYVAHNYKPHFSPFAGR